MISYAKITAEIEYQMCYSCLIVLAV